MKVMPSSSHRRANDAFSDRKPYPGWIACTPFALAVSMMPSNPRYAPTGVSPGFTQYDSSALYRCVARRSASEKMATVRMPSSVPARNTRTAISPRFAHRILSSLPVFERRILPKPDSASTSAFSAGGSEMAARGDAGARDAENRARPAAARDVRIAEPRAAAREESGVAAAPVADAAAGTARGARGARATGAAPARAEAEADMVTPSTRERG